MISSLVPKVREYYSAGLLRFHQFCDAINMAEANLGAAKKWLCGVRSWHDIHGGGWQQRNMTARVLSGVAKLVLPSSSRDQRLPITYKYIVARRDGLDLGNSRDAAVWAITSIAFWECCRLGELLIPSVNTFDAEQHVAGGTDANVKYSCAISDELPYATFRIPWTKTKHRVGAEIKLMDIPDEMSPFQALRNHLRVNKDVPDGAPLFAFKTEEGWAPMILLWFMKICNEIWQDAKLDCIKTGHSFRIGSPNMVAQLGRWESDSFLVYWRKMEKVLPIYIAWTFYSSSTAAAQEAMNAFASPHHLF
ncbi:hypothetical protein OF83DRAFT_1165386 [Amylostereum chailletii]|nr:hypothetical protein OF83DRAFT_1165386 [Amylostereum chailletii]